MRWFVGLAAGMGIVALAIAAIQGVFGGLPGTFSHTPRDVAAAGFAAPPESLRIVAFGTSLTARADWPEALANELETCLARPVSIEVVAAPGQTSLWARAQVARVLDSDPNVVLMEFTANDADARDGMTVRESRRVHEAILVELRARAPEVRVILMSMNPTHGLRGLLRWRHGAYRAAYHALAEDDPKVGYLDHDARWRQSMNPAQRRAAIPDGLHPRPEAVRKIIVPSLATAVGDLFNQNCPNRA